MTRSKGATTVVVMPCHDVILGKTPILIYHIVGMCSVKMDEIFCPCLVYVVITMSKSRSPPSSPGQILNSGGLITFANLVIYTMQCRPYPFNYKFLCTIFCLKQGDACLARLLKCFPASWWPWLWCWAGPVWPTRPSEGTRSPLTWSWARCWTIWPETRRQLRTSSLHWAMWVSQYPSITSEHHNRES